MKPRGLTQYSTLISQRAKIEGFVVCVGRDHVVLLTDLFTSFDYAKDFPRAIEEVAAGLADGSIKRKFHIVEGLHNAPGALPMLFSGTNTGKL